jgi:serine/threonine protein kinase
MESLVGKSLGDRYRLLGLLGSGGMGDVYLAEHILLGKRMAVKILKDDYSRNKELVERFRQEARAASRIGQENIVNVTDFGWTAEGAAYFVMEALEGTNLKSLLTREGQIPLHRAIPILVQVSRALAAAHAQGIIHRDLKAENVMIVPRDEGGDLVKVLDFGISKVSAMEQAGDGKRLTRNGAVMGTPDYMAPEQALGDGVDPRADIYSIGVLTYEMMTGTVPFQSSSVMEVLVMHMRDRPEPPSHRRPDLNLPAELDAFVLRALEKEPDKRQQSMNEVKEELKRIGRIAPGLSLTAEPPSDSGPRRVTPYPSAGVTPEAFAPTSVSLPQVPHPTTAPTLPHAAPPANAIVAPPRRSRAPWVVLALGIPAAAVGAYLFARQPAPPPVVVTLAPPPPAPVVEPPPPPPPPPVVAVAPPPSPVVEPVATAHPPPPRPIPEKLSEATLKAVVARSAGRGINACVRTQSRDGLPRGELVVQFKVPDSGEVEDVKFQTPGLGNIPVAVCVLKVFRGLHFPPHSGNAQLVTLPLQFEGDDAKP